MTDCFRVTLLFATSAVISANAWTAEAETADPLAVARQEYAERVIWFPEWTKGFFGNEASGGSRTVPLQGPLSIPLEQEELYQALGRADLARSYRFRDRVGSALVLTGTLAMVASMYFLFSPIWECGQTTDGQNSLPADCSEALRFNLATGFAVLGGGLVAIFGGAVLDPHPVSRGEAMRLVRQHNEEVRKELGLPAAEPLPFLRRDHQERTWNWQLGPGGGLFVASF